MLFDWFTVGAQIVNFLVLVFLLQRFLYGPIVEAMDAREQKIADRLQSAQQKEDQATKRHQEYSQKLDELEDQRSQLFADAQEEAEARKQELIQDARDEVERLRQDWLDTIGREKKDFLRQLRRRSGDHIYQVARRTLSDLADVELEAQMIRRFIQRLEDLPEAEREDIVRAARDPEKGVAVRSAFDLSDQAHEEIRELLRNGKKDHDADLEVRFTTQPDLIAGIELKAKSRIVAWNLESHLQRLEADITETMEEMELGRQNGAES